LIYKEGDRKTWNVSVKNRVTSGEMDDRIEEMRDRSGVYVDPWGDR